MSWPWRLQDERPHGWFTANGLSKFGPLPQRERTTDETWPPRALEPPITVRELQKREA